MIDVQHLTKRYGSHLAVDDISFRLERGEVVGFLGPNGAGKTTTMRILTGFLPATRGKVSIAGFDVLRQALEVRKRIGYLPENVPLYPEHRVSEVLRFQGRLHGLGRREIKQRSAAVLERVGLTDRSRSLIGSLSRGLRQRAGLAVALLPQPEVLILDEPTSGLDPLQRIEVRKLVVELAEEHTVLLSSHILAEIEAVAPRVVILNKGRIAADGTPSALVEKLGGGRSVRLEAVVGDAQQARELLESLEGVERVDDGGKLGIHHCFDIVVAEDLREDVGALAAVRGWAIRELSFKQPSLEQLFASIALELDGLAPSATPATQDANTEPIAIEQPQLGASQTELPIMQAPLASPESAPTPTPTTGGATLNPFEQFGAAPAPSKPKGTEPASGPASSAPTPPAKGPAAEPPKKTLNPFENFGQSSTAGGGDDA